MSRILIAGIGSPFGADTLGWEVVDRLLQDDQLGAYIPHQINLLKLDRPGSALLNEVADYDIVLLVDAVQSGAERGRLIRLTEHEIVSNQTGVSSHGLGLAETIELGKVMQALPERVILFGLEVGDQPQQAFDAATIKRFIEQIRTQLIDIMMAD